MNENINGRKEAAKKTPFYKRRGLYLALTILFSVILLGDLAIAFLVPSWGGGFGNLPEGFDMDFSEGFDMELPEGFSEGDLPEGFSGDLPEGFSEGDLPEGFSEGDLPESFEDMEPPSGDFSGGDFSGGEMPDFGGMQDMGQPGGGFLWTVKAYWLPIFIVFAILDAASIFMLVRVSREKKKRHFLELSERQSGEEAPLIPRKPGKKKKQSHSLWVIALVGMLLLGVVVKMLTLPGTGTGSQTEASVYTKTAETGEIRSVLPGTGTLQEEAAESLSLPAEVEIEEWYVSDGETVEVGDRLARVDQVSAMSAIVTVQETLAELDEELKESEDDESADTITAETDGRVKVIYAAEDVSVVDTMYESGCLMRLSLDGMMAVSIETEAALSVGDSVTVTLSDGAAESGRVESVIAGTAVITVTDEGTVYGDSVTVTTEDGAAVGTGTLYIHSELKVTGFNGTVADIAVSEEEEVTGGDTLLTLEDTAYTGKYELLLTQRQTLEEQQQKLFQLYQNGYVYAEYAGVISGLEEDGTSSGDDGAGGDDGSSGDDGTSGDVGASGDDSTSGDGSTSGDDSTSGDAGASGDDGTDGIASAGLKSNNSVILTRTDGGGLHTVSASLGDDAGGQSGTGGSDEAGSGSGTGSEGGTGNEGGNGSSDGAGAGDEGGTGSEGGTGNEDGTGNVGGTGSESGAGDGGTGSGTGSEGGAEGSGTGIPDGSGTENQGGAGSQGSPESGNGTGGPDGMQLPDANGSGGTEGTIPGGAEGDGSGGTEGTIPGGQNAMPDFSQNTMGTEDGTVSGQSMEEDIKTAYEVSETTWLFITPQETMDIAITVDELDILELEVGQEALITLDALPGQSFEGNVASIDVSGTNSGGSSKYTAVIRIERQENMLAGMNASVEITLDVKEDVLLIPEEALVEEESGVYVYTSYDEETETFGGLIEVTTGLSDGENVEILSGLSEGSEYWYSSLDVVNYSGNYAAGGGGSLMRSLFRR